MSIFLSSSRGFLGLIALVAMTSVYGEIADWHCEENRVTGQWHCGLSTKPLPILDVKIKKNTTWFSDAFSASEEQVFNHLRKGFSHNPWAMCVSPNSPRQLFSVNKTARDFVQTDIHANFGEMFDQDYSHFWGNIDLVHADQTLFSAQADYHGQTRTINLYGDVVYRDATTALYGESAKIGLGNDKVILRDTLFMLPNTPLRGRAGALYRENKVLTRLKDVSYTACEPHNQDWVLHASKMKINDATGRASVKHGWLEFQHVPILYFPYASFPIDDRRKSGLLTPALGFSGRSGFDLTLPYYWNIAPNYDLVLSPRYMSDRGFMMGADFRYLWQHSEGELNIEVLPEDNLTKTTRWGGSFQHYSQLNQNLSVAWDANYVTDKAYFSQLDGSLGMGNRDRYLTSHADMSYNLSWLTARLHFENYQNIDPLADNKDVPYRRLPQLTINVRKALNNWPVLFEMESDYVLFQRHFDDGLVEGQRLNLKPSLTFPFHTEYGFISPKVALQHTHYWLANQTGAAHHTESKTLPILSLDTGLFFERQFEQFKHTLEPRLYYLYVPYTDQENLPNFDVSVADFNSSQLFRDNTFNGWDKTQNANQLTMALTTRIMKSGRETLKLSMGEIFYFADRRVNISGNAVHKHWLSNMIIELDSELNPYVNISAGMQWNHEHREIDRGNIGLRYHDAKQRIVNFNYRYRAQRNDQIAQEQIVASAIIPIYEGWSVIGLYRYSLFDRRALEYFYGVEKESCCWRFRIIARQFIRGDLVNNLDNNIKPENSVFVQLELKGFTSLGEKLEDFMQENIPSYIKPSY